MWKARLRVDLKCPVHPRYNPEKGGKGAVKAGCVMCADIAIAYEKLTAADGVKDWIGIAQDSIQNYENERILRK
jgi:hypothetical protein